MKPEDISAGPVIMTVAEIGAFLIEHGDIIAQVREAFRQGRSKAEVMAGIRSAMLLASEGAMVGVLGAREGGGQ